jgi:hypothetical protein
VPWWQHSMRMSVDAALEAACTIAALDSITGVPKAIAMKAGTALGCGRCAGALTGCALVTGTAAASSSCATVSHATTGAVSQVF